MGNFLLESGDAGYDSSESKLEISLCEVGLLGVCPPLMWFWRTVPSSLGHVSLQWILETESPPEGKLGTRSRHSPWNMPAVYAKNHIVGLKPTGDTGEQNPFHVICGPWPGSQPRSGKHSLWLKCFKWMKTSVDTIGILRESNDALENGMRPDL